MRRELRVLQGHERRRAIRKGAWPGVGGLLLARAQSSRTTDAQDASAKATGASRVVERSYLSFDELERASTRQPLAKAIEEMEAAFERLARSLRGKWQKIAKPLLDDPWNLLNAYNSKEWAGAVADSFVEDWGTSVSRVFETKLLAETNKLGFTLRDHNPLVEEYLAKRSSELIGFISETTRDAVRTALEEGYRAGIGSRAIGRQIDDLVGLHPNQVRAVARRRAKLLEQGMESSRVEKEIGRYANKLLKLRGQNIARTEMAEAYSDATLTAWNEASAEGVITSRSTKTWIAAPSERTCKNCMALHGQTVLLQDYFTTTDGTRILRPPLHPSCRCPMSLKVT